MRIFQSDHASHQVKLNIKRQAGADPVGVILVGAQTLGFEKNLVTFLVGKPVDLVFDTGTVAWPNTFNLAGEHRTAIKAAADDVVGALIGVCDPA
jgi:hypothetical protein